MEEAGPMSPKTRLATAGNPVGQFNTKKREQLDIQNAADDESIIGGYPHRNDNKKLATTVASLVDSHCLAHADPSKNQSVLEEQYWGPPMNNGGDDMYEGGSGNTSVSGSVLGKRRRRRGDDEVENDDGAIANQQKGRPKRVRLHPFPKIAKAIDDNDEGASASPVVDDTTTAPSSLFERTGQSSISFRRQASFLDQQDVAMTPPNATSAPRPDQRIPSKMTKRNASVPESLSSNPSKSLDEPVASEPVTSALRDAVDVDSPSKKMSRDDVSKSVGNNEDMDFSFREGASFDADDLFDEDNPLTDGDDATASRALNAAAIMPKL
ncbi:MAG: hypothetical protein SGARI_000881, partial [Bacillariaceae sp.]